MIKGDWASVDWREALGVMAVSGFVGLIRFLFLLKRGRQFKWIDMILEPCLAILGGMLVWAMLEVGGAADVWQAAMTSLGAWGGPRTIQWLEHKYMGGDKVRQKPDLASTMPGDFR